MDYEIEIPDDDGYEDTEPDSFEDAYFELTGREYEENDDNNYDEEDDEYDDEDYEDDDEYSFVDDPYFDGDDPILGG